MFAELLFWCFWILVVYVYIGYPLFLLVIYKIKRSEGIHRADITPFVSFIIPAFNEEKAIAQKIENTLMLDYPKEKLEIIISSDGSTDNTNDIVKRYESENVKLVVLETNQGKSAAENAGLLIANGDIILFSDATGIYDRCALRELVRPFADEKVGCVVGMVKYHNTHVTASTDGEGIYWRYEVFIRQLESRVGNLAMASGSIFACRRFLVQPLDESVGEDFVIPLMMVKQGFRTIYEPQAISKEMVAETDRSIFKTKNRIITKDLRGLFFCSFTLNPFRYPLYAWGLISHKLLRWLVPYFLIIIFITNLLILERPFYFLTFILQVVFYTMSFVGYLWQKKGKPPRILGIFFSFCLTNLAALVGVMQFLMGKKTGRWIPIR